MAQHHALVDEAVWKLVHRKISQRILMVREPPRHGKSEHLSHWTPAWYEANWPDREVIVTGYGNTFAQKWGRRSRNSFALIAALFGTALADDRQAAHSWGTIHGGGCITAGIGGGIGGEGAHLAIVDDLIKNPKDAQSEAYRENAWDWFRSTLWTRLAPEGVCILIGTSWHRDDYQQRVKREFGDEVLDIALPAVAEEGDLLGRKIGEVLWPSRWPEEWYAKQKLLEGPYYWNALYQQRPSQYEEAEWDDALFEGIWYDELPHESEILFKVLSLDPSLGGMQTKNGDYSAYVMLTLAKDGLIYVDADISRRDIVSTVDAGLSICHAFQPNAWSVEVNGFQALDNLIVERSKGMMPPIATVTQHHDKVSRIRIGVGPYLAYRKLRFKRGSRGAGLLVEQLKDFPLGDKDDGPDSLETGLRTITALESGDGPDYNPSPSLVYA